LSDIEHQLDAEFAEYIKNLTEKMDQVQNALDRKLNREAMSESDAAELKRLYVKIVKMSHPDLAVNQTQKKHELFLKAVAAYEKADLETIRAISVLLDDAASLDYLPETPGVLEELAKKKEMLRFKCEQTKNEIEQIKNAYPYNKKDFLDNPKQVQARTDELNHIFALYQKELKDMKERLAVITGENRE